MCLIQMILGLIASLDLKLEDLNVKTVFVHSDLEKEIYMDQLDEFEIKEKGDMVYKLKKSLYGLKLTLKQCCKKFNSFMDHCVYFRTF